MSLSSLSCLVPPGSCCLKPLEKELDDLHHVTPPSLLIVQSPNLGHLHLSSVVFLGLLILIVQGDLMRFNSSIISVVSPVLEFLSKLVVRIISEWAPASQLKAAFVDFWLRYKQGAGKWVDKLSVSLVVCPLPRQVPEASRGCMYLLLSDFPFWLSFSGFKQIPVPVCSSKDWKNNHRVDGRDPNSLRSDGVHRDLLEFIFTTLLVSRQFPSGSTIGNQQLCFLLFMNLLLSPTSGSWVEPCSLPSFSSLSLCHPQKRFVVVGKGMV